MPFATRLTVALIGLVLLYSASLYEDRTKKLVSSLELLWIKIDELRVQGRKERAALLNVASREAAKFIDRLFGPTLLSVRAIAVSLVFPLAPFLLSIEVFSFRLREVMIAGGLVLISAVLIILFGVFITPLSFLLFTSRPRVAKVATLALVCLESLLFLILWSSEREWITGFVVGALSAIALIALNRAVLAWCAITGSTGRVTAAVLLNVILVSLLSVVPWSFGHRLQPTIDRLEPIFNAKQGALARASSEDIEEVMNPGSDTADRHRREREAQIPSLTEELRQVDIPLQHYKSLRNALYLFAICSFSTILVTLSVLMLLVVLLIHRLIWPLAAQLVYPLSQYGLFENRKFLAVSGLSLLALAGGPGVFRSILSALH